MKFPGAIVKLMPHGAEDPPIVPCGLVFHVAENTGPSLFPDGFPVAGTESHFYVRLTGEIEQYRDTGIQADAQLDGNGFQRDGKSVGFLSVETAGMESGRWTDEQIASLKKLARWVHEKFDIPLRKCPAWNQPGYGFHTMFGAPSHWTPSVKTCPGPERIKQFNTIIVPWLEAGAPAEEPDMLLSDPIGKHTDVTVGEVLRRMDTYLTKTVPAMRKQTREQMRDQMRKFRAEIDAVPDGVTAAEMKKTVHRALEGLDATIQLVVDKDEDPIPLQPVGRDDT
jgi:hypothetical protein